MAHKSHFSLDVGWQLLLKDLGLQSRHVLRRALLPEDTLSRENHGLTTDEYFRFWWALEQEANDVLFPLRLIETVSSEVFSPSLFAALCSPDLMRAVQRLAKYKALIAPMSLEITVGSGGEMTLSPRWQGGHTEVPLSLQVVELAFFVRLAQIATREAIHAVRVTLPALPSGKSLQRYERFFGTAITPGAPASITFSAVDVLRPFLTSNEGMWRAFEPELRRQLCEMDPAATTAERVHAVLLELLPSNSATIEVAASRLGMSKRTLQRRLEEEGENFRALVSETRRRLACHYLEHTTLSGGEIAFLLGFEDPNSFYRAFQDWTGRTLESTRQSYRFN